MIKTKVAFMQPLEQFKKFSKSRSSKKATCALIM